MAKTQNHDKFSLTVTLILTFVILALGGLIYIYSDFVDRNPLQSADMVKIARENFDLSANDPSDQYSMGKTQSSSQKIDPKDLKIQKNNNSSTLLVPSNSENNGTIEYIKPDNDNKKENTLNTKKKTPQDLKLTQVFFVKITDSGHISLKQVDKKIQTNLPPVNAALQSLLEGPSSVEKNHGIQSMIPAGSKLLSLSIENEIAHLNFNEEFMFNPFGTDGYHAQLQQIIYTVTKIPNVKAVQIAIEGKKVDFLYEGVYIGKPLSRNSFH